MTVLIMAGGQQSRWNGDTPKQLTDVDGETVIGRIIRQVKRFNPRQRYQHPKIMTQQYNAISWHGYQQDCYTEGKNIGRWIAETLLKYLTDPYTKVDYYTVLLGDTIYSKATMNAIMTCDKPIAFFADAGEIYALTFHRDRIPVIQSALERIVHAAENGEFGTYPPHKHEPGKLWHLYRVLAGHPLLEHRPNFHDDLLVEVTDWTTDLDTRDDYYWFCDNVLTMGLLDDLPMSESEG